MDQDETALRATEAYDSAKSAHKRLDALEKEVNDVHELAKAMATVSTNVDNLTKDVDEIKTEVKKVAERPKNWWDKLVAAAIGAIGSGIIAAVLAQILK